jgi:phosphate transport system permease protein
LNLSRGGRILVFSIIENDGLSYESNNLAGGPSFGENAGNGFLSAPGAISGRLLDLGFRVIPGIAMMLVVAILVAVFVVMISASVPAIRAFGVGLFSGPLWNPPSREFGIVPLVGGSIIASSIALILAAPLSIGTAVFLVEYSDRAAVRIMAAIVDMSASVPSVVFGLWGVFVLAPAVQRIGGPALLSAGMIIAIMVIPIVTAAVRGLLLNQPSSQREAAFALGATRWDVTRLALGNSAIGISGAVLLGFGRALGETIAVAMILGSFHGLVVSLLSPSQTMTTVIAKEFAQSPSPLFQSTLIEIGLVLLVITSVTNAIARLLIGRTAGVSETEEAVAR